MKIKKFEEMFEHISEEHIIEKSKKIKEFKQIIEDTFYAGFALGGTETDLNNNHFKDYWKINGDKLLLKAGLLEN